MIIPTHNTSTFEESSHYMGFNVYNKLVLELTFTEFDNILQIKIFDI